MNSIFRTTNIYKTRKHIVLVRDDREINTYILKTDFLKKRTAKTGKELKEAYFPVPSRVLSASQISNLIQSAAEPKTAEAQIKTLYTKTERANFKNKGEMITVYSLKEPVPAGAARAIAPLLKKNRIAPLHGG